MAKELDKKASGIAEKYTKLLNYDIVNKAIEDSELNIEISKKTILNISKWALNGASDKDIRDNLELSANQFKLLCELCPVVVAVMQNSREMADILITGSLVQTAIGGKTYKEQQLMKINDYDDEGNKIGEHVETFWVEKELPPNPILLKFIAEHKLSEQFGGEKANKDNEIKSIVGTLDADSLKEMEKTLKESK